MTTLKSFKTPLRYAGGKSRACKKLDKYFPDFSNYKEFREPFLGGGSVALHITKNNPHLDIWVSDLYEPLVNFWQVLKMHGEDLTDQLLNEKFANDNPDLARKLFNDSKSIINKPIHCSSFDRAVAFYIVNKCSFSGLTEGSSFSPQASDSNFSIRGIKKLRVYSEIISNWYISNFSYEYLMTEVDNKDVFMYLDPPYDIKDNLYGKNGSMHKGFDHDMFAVDCDNSMIDMLISYNADQLVKDRFNTDQWHSAEFDLTYTMRSVGEYMKKQKKRKEIVLANYKFNEEE